MIASKTVQTVTQPEVKAPVAHELPEEEEVELTLGEPNIPMRPTLV